MTAEQAKASENMVACIILVHSILVISLFDSDASHCYIFTIFVNFVMMHYIPCDDMNTKWDIITRNEVIEKHLEGG